MKSPAIPTFPRREKSRFAAGALVNSNAEDGEGAKAMAVRNVDIDDVNDGKRAALQRRRGEDMVAGRLPDMTWCGVSPGTTSSIPHRGLNRGDDLAMGRSYGICGIGNCERRWRVAPKEQGRLRGGSADRVGTESSRTRGCRAQVGGGQTNREN